LTLSWQAGRVSVIERDEAWLLRLKEAPGPNVPFALRGGSRVEWEAQVSGVAWAYLKRQGVRAAFLERFAQHAKAVQVPRLKMGQPAPPGASIWRELERRLEALSNVLQFFAPTGPQNRHLPDECWDLKGDPGALQQMLGVLRTRANEALSAVKRTGRPAVDPNALFAVRMLLHIYHFGFEREPSPSPEGPTVRFVREFFGGLEGEWCSPRMGPLKSDGLAPARTFETPKIVPQTVPTLIEKAVEAEQIEREICARRVTRQAVGQNPTILPVLDMEGLFARPFTRPVT
jgi:hypothetical protein